MESKYTHSLWLTISFAQSSNHTLAGYPFLTLFTLSAFPKLVAWKSNMREQVCDDPKLFHAAFPRS